MIIYKCLQRQTLFFVIQYFTLRGRHKKYERITRGDGQTVLSECATTARNRECWRFIAATTREILLEIQCSYSKRQGVGAPNATRTRVNECRVFIVTRESDSVCWRSIAAKAIDSGFSRSIGATARNRMLETHWNYGNRQSAGASMQAGQESASVGDPLQPGQVTECCRPIAAKSREGCFGDPLQPRQDTDSVVDQLQRTCLVGMSPD